MRKVAVTGGSGQLGSLIVQRLIADATIDAVLCIDRVPPRPASQKLEFVKLDIRSERLMQHLRGCDAVVHCAFLVTDNAPPALFRSVNVDGSKNVFQSAAAADVGTIVHLSSMLAYGSVPGHPVPILESTTRIHQPDFLYAACKHEVEAFLDRFEPAHPDIAISRLRPAVLLGRSITNALGWLLRRRIVPGQAGAPLSIVSDEDVADLAVLALHRRARGAFNAGADELLMPEAVAERFDMFVLNLPNFLVHGYRAFDWCLKSIGLQFGYDAAWFTKTQGVALVLSSERAKNELGWSPRHPTAAAVLKHFIDIAPRRLDHRLRAIFALLRRAGRQPVSGLVDRSVRVYLCISGEYGGDVLLRLDDGNFSIRRMTIDSPSGAIHLRSEILLQALAGQIEIDQARQRGEIVFDGSDGPFMLARMIAVSQRLLGEQGFRGLAARVLMRSRPSN